MANSPLNAHFWTRIAERSLADDAQEHLVRPDLPVDRHMLSLVQVRAV